LDRDEVIGPKSKGAKALAIESAMFNERAYTTELFLAGDDQPLEIIL
jgi:hypothetical protein